MAWPIHSLQVKVPPKLQYYVPVPIMTTTNAWYRFSDLGSFLSFNGTGRLVNLCPMPLLPYLYSRGTTICWCVLSIMSLPSCSTPQEISKGHIDFDSIASLLLEDVGEVKALRKDKGREDAPPTDDVVAFDLFADELKSLLLVIQDERLARSMVDAVNTDHALIEELERIDARVLEDRSIAIRMQRGEDISHPLSVAHRGNPAKSSRVLRHTASPSQGVEPPSQATEDANHSPRVLGPASPSEGRCVLFKH